MVSVPESPVRRTLLALSLLTAAAWAVGALVEAPTTGSALKPESTATPWVLAGEAAPDDAAPARSIRPTSDPVSARDIFGAGARPTTVAAAAMGRSDLDLVLLTTVVSEDHSYAAAWLGPTGAASTGYALGDRVGDAVVVDISDRAVVLERDSGQLEQVTMDGDGVSPVEPAAVGAGGELPAVTVDPAAWARALEAPASMLDGAQAIPHRDGRSGAVDGYRLSGLRPGTFLHGLGVRNGDVLHAVAGVPVTSPTGAMSALEAARQSAQVDIQLTRRGRRSSYSILLP